MKQKVRESADRQKTELQPYEKFVKMGAESLTEAELLAIILRTGTRDCSAMQLASEVLQSSFYGGHGLLGLHKITIEQLQKIKGVGPVKAVKIKSIAELSKRMASAKAWEEVVFQKSGTVAACYMERLRHRGTECVVLLMLDSKGHLLKEVQLSSGTVRASLISPREIFIEALKAEAVQIIMVHNHPSGDPAPSREDVRITQLICSLGEAMELPLTDHIIIGDNRYVSFKEQGLL